MAEKEISPGHWNMILKAIYERACVPFLGAAVNISDNKGYKGLPAGKEVALRLIEELTGVKVNKIEDLATVENIREDIKKAGLAEDLARLNFQNLPRVALHVEVQSAMKRAYLLQLIREILPDKDCQPSPLLQLLAQMPFSLIVTTNFDRLLERALDQAIEKSVPITVQNLMAPWRLALQLRGAADPVSQYLMRQFSAVTRKLLDSYKEETAPSEQLLESLARELDEQLSNDNLYDEERFGGVILKSELRQLIEAHPSGNERKRLNRLLLEAAYPFDLAKSRGPYQLVVPNVSGSKGGKHDKYLDDLTEEVTIVYKIHGSFPKEETVEKKKGKAKKKAFSPSSLIVTEEDYIQFMATVGKKEGGIPVKISRSMVRGSMLFLGYSLEDWDFRTIYKGLLESQENDDGRTSFAIQWDPPKFWEDYWRQKGVIIYDYDIYRFAEELEKKYVAKFGALSAFKPMS